MLEANILIHSGVHNLKRRLILKRRCSFLARARGSVNGSVGEGAGSGPWGRRSAPASPRLSCWGLPEPHSLLWCHLRASRAERVGGTGIGTVHPRGDKHSGRSPREDGKQARTGGSETGRAGRMRQAPAAGEGAPPRRARGRVTPTQGTLSPPHREAAAQRGSPKVTRLARAGAGV